MKSRNGSKADLYGGPGIAQEIAGLTKSYQEAKSCVVLGCRDFRASGAGVRSSGKEMMTPIISCALLESLNTLSDHLRRNILGQDEVLEQIVSLLRRSLCGMRYARRPVASMLFLGPTGVGKTEVVNLFTQHLFGSKDKLVRLDMSEFQNQTALGVLMGNQVGERGLLGYYFERSGGSGTLLFDEIEKADRRVLDIFLQILSAGRFTLADGETLDLSGYVVVSTSNIGGRMLMESQTTDRETLVRRTEQAARTEMRPETLARFDLRCVFSKLSYQVQREIAALHVSKALEIVNASGHEIECDPGVVEYVQREGYDEYFGARPMEQAAMRSLGDLVSQEMLAHGGGPVRGVIAHDKRMNRCFLRRK